MARQVKFSERPVSASDVQDVERGTGIAFPAEYTAWLLQHNGGRPVPGYFDITGPNNASRIDQFYPLLGGDFSFEEQLRTFRRRIPAGFVPIGNDSAGNQILMCLEGEDHGSIWFWDHEQEADGGESPSTRNMVRMAASFPAFLDNLRD